MAGEWIKIRPSLLTSPKINGIARVLESDKRVSPSLSTGFNGVMSEIVTRNVMRHVTLSSLVTIWGNANEHTHDGVFKNADLSDIDDMVGIIGFGDAMASVGWAEFDEEQNTVTLPNFNEYNTSGQKRSANAKTSAERQKEYRERKKLQESNVTRDVTSYVTSNRREEKRREDITTTPKSPTGTSGKNPSDENPSRKKPAIEIKTFIEQCKANDEKVLPPGDPIFKYATDAKIPDDFLTLAWREFRDRMISENRRQKDWRMTFRKYIRGNYLNLWRVNYEGVYELTTTGKQAENSQRSKAV